jgi:Capsule assembly protein Wzi
MPFLMKCNLVLFGIFTLIASCVSGQDSLVSADIRAEGSLLSSRVPFWLRADQHGSIPLANASASFIGGVHKLYNTTDNPWIDWGGALEVRANTGPTSQVTIIEGYLKMALSVFEIKAGRTKDAMGLMDSSLSSGSFSVSGNALGIPKAEISIPQYYTIPIFDGLFAIKGNFGFGLIGKTPVQYSLSGQSLPDSQSLDTYFHQKSFYGRLGKDSWRVHLFAGFNHQVFWGQENKVWGKVWDLSSWQTLKDVVFGKTWNNSKVGNHLGSIDLGMQYDFEGFRVFLYRQNFYDEGALYHLANIRDGLNGISITGIPTEPGGFTFRKAVLEFLCSTNQAGYPWSIRTKSGDEDYYNNYEYTRGWSYKGLALGNPLFTTKEDIRSNLPQDPKQYFSNNRILALHAALECSINTLEITSKLTFSKNKGTFSTSVYGASTGNHFDPPRYGIFPEVDEFSGYLMISNSFENGYKLGVALAVDKGSLLYNSSGIIVKLSKSFYGSYRKASMYND